MSKSKHMQNTSFMKDFIGPLLCVKANIYFIHAYYMYEMWVLTSYFMKGFICLL